MIGSLAVTIECPECGHPGPHDANRDRWETTACCANCGEHFDLQRCIECRTWILCSPRQEFCDQCQA